MNKFNKVIMSFFMLFLCMGNFCFVNANGKQDHIVDTQNQDVVTRAAYGREYTRKGTAVVNVSGFKQPFDYEIRLHVTWDNETGRPLQGQFVGYNVSLNNYQQSVSLEVVKIVKKSKSIDFVINPHYEGHIDGIWLPIIGSGPEFTLTVNSPGLMMLNE